MTLSRKRSTTPSYRIIVGVSDQVTPGIFCSDRSPKSQDVCPFSVILKGTRPTVLQCQAPLSTRLYVLGIRSSPSPSRLTILTDWQEDSAVCSVIVSIPTRTTYVIFYDAASAPSMTQSPSPTPPSVSLPLSHVSLTLICKTDGA